MCPSNIVSWQTIFFCICCIHKSVGGYKGFVKHGFRAVNGSNWEIIFKQVRVHSYSRIKVFGFSTLPLKKRLDNVWRFRPGGLHSWLADITKRLKISGGWNGKEPSICVLAYFLCLPISRFKLLVKRICNLALGAPCSSHTSKYGSSSCKTSNSRWCCSWNQPLSVTMSWYWKTNKLHNDLSWKQWITGHHESQKSNNFICIQRILTFCMVVNLKKVPPKQPPSPLPFTCLFHFKIHFFFLSFAPFIFSATHRTWCVRTQLC